MAEGKTEKPEFEEALDKLESIIDSMESGETPLAELVDKFEEGNKLLKICQEKLKDAELKIELLKKENEKAEATPFDGDVET